MGWLAVLFVLLLALMAFSGCNGMARWQEAMAGDPATVTGQVTSIYGTAKFVRIGEVKMGQEINANPDGTVRVTGVPLQAVPALTAATTAVKTK